MQYVNIEQTYTVFCLFGGMGGGALGAQMATAEYRGLKGRAVILGSVDSDPDACADFEMLTGVKATVMDLFDREQYRDWWGVEPPADWREATPEDIRAAAQGQDPDVVLITAPCKGFSGLLSQERSNSRKYQALNRLTFRGVFLAMEAWKHNLPAFILFENVPRIATRGQKFLREIKGLLSAYGYVFDATFHDCGELGGLAQHRRRYLLVARNPAKVSSYLYHPPKQRVRAIGEILGEMPLPDDADAGPLHRLPRLQWRTWVRLALIPPGGDWRDLQRIQPGQYTITYSPRDGALRVGCWDAPASPVVGSAAVTSSNGIAAVADPRLGCQPRNGTMGVLAWDRPAGTVTASGDVHAGAAAVADPRIPADDERGTWVIVSPWGYWHRPLTTLELMALQGFPTRRPDGSPIVLAGRSDRAWRERIGNAVPPPTMAAIMGQMLYSMLASETHDWRMDVFQTGTWVRPETGEGATA